MVLVVGTARSVRISYSKAATNIFMNLCKIRECLNFEQHACYEEAPLASFYYLQILIVYKWTDGE